jgi:phosphate transport system protein
VKRVRRAAAKESSSTKELTGLIRQACLVARDGASNTKEFVSNSSKMAFLAVKDCEKELDRIERNVDEKITSAITEVTEPEARELLACLKFILDLERIGDLCWTVTKRLHGSETQLLPYDRRDLSHMAQTLEQMLDHIHRGFIDRDLTAAAWVLQTDAKMNQTCRTLFQRHLEHGDAERRDYSTNLLFVAQAFERAGDHTKNLAEELYNLVEGRSVKHEMKRHGHES